MFSTGVERERLRTQKLLKHTEHTQKKKCSPINHIDSSKVIFHILSIMEAESISLLINFLKFLLNCVCGILDSS